jgi:hypothetical protein
MLATIVFVVAFASTASAVVAEVVVADLAILPTPFKVSVISLVDFPLLNSDYKDYLTPFYRQVKSFSYCVADTIGKNENNRRTIGKNENALPHFTSWRSQLVKIIGQGKEKALPSRTGLLSVRT